MSDDAPKATVRPFQPRDRGAVRAICRATAYRNKGSATVFEDDELFADYWTRYYTDFEPESAFVLDMDGKVVGYILGCADSVRHRRIMARRVVPRFILTASWRALTGQYSNPATKRMLWWMISQGWREEPDMPIERFPAHYHINILHEASGGGYWLKLVSTFLARLDGLGVERIHGNAEEPAAGGPWKRAVRGYTRHLGTEMKLEHFAESPSTFHQYVLGVDKPMVNRVWGCRVEDYRKWIEWTSRHYHM